MKRSELDMISATRVRVGSHAFLFLSLLCPVKCYLHDNLAREIAKFNQTEKKKKNLLSIPVSMLGAKDKRTGPHLKCRQQRNTEEELDEKGWTAEVTPKSQATLSSKYIKIIRHNPKVCPRHVQQ